MNSIDVENWFTHHPPQRGLLYCRRIIGQVSDGPEKQKAVEAVSEAVMWANAGTAYSSA